MSIFKSNKFFRIIKHFILCLPLMFVLGVSLYTIVNSNAKDSYYGETINERIETFVDYTDLEQNQRYVFKSNLYASGSASALGTLYIDDFSTPSVFAPTSTSIDWNIEDANYITFYTRSNLTISLEVHKFNSSYYFQRDLTNNFTEFEYTYLSLSNSTAPVWDYFNNNYLITFNEYSYLNNAFEYGMYQFTQIGFGQFDFVSFFNGIFTTNINNVYASFINDYINYYLFVELIYFVPWVFHMFIHFAYDLGDYFTSSFKRNRKEDD